MYQPPHFREPEIAAQHELIRAHPLGLLISTGTEGALADPIPFLLYADEGPLGTLRCHVSRANPQWLALQGQPQALVVFLGGESYITPSWYATKAEHGKVVPTWNYAVVQARGPALVIEDAAWLYANVSALTRQNERTRPMLLGRSWSRRYSPPSSTITGAGRYGARKSRTAMGPLPGPPAPCGPVNVLWTL